ARPQLAARVAVAARRDTRGALHDGQQPEVADTREAAPVVAQEVVEVVAAFDPFVLRVLPGSQESRRGPQRGHRRRTAAALCSKAAVLVLRALDESRSRRSVPLRARDSARAGQREADQKTCNG